MGIRGSISSENAEDIENQHSSNNLPAVDSHCMLKSSSFKKRAAAFTPSNESNCMHLSLHESTEKCQVCFSSLLQESLLQCRGCNARVHPSCYGESSSAEDEQSWLCSPCARRSKSQQCVLCPVSGGALKPTDNGKWAHVGCAIWIPETYIGDVRTMEPVSNLLGIHPDRYRLGCKICKRKGKNSGAVIQCLGGRCAFSFHPMCGLLSGIHMKVSVTKDGWNICEVLCPIHQEMYKTPASRLQACLKSKYVKKVPSVDLSRSLVDAVESRSSHHNKQSYRSPSKGSVAPGGRVTPSRKAMHGRQRRIDDHISSSEADEQSDDDAGSVDDPESFASIEIEDDDVCSVCNNGDVEDGNEIVYCSSCDVAVHQACYGISHIPEDDWYCEPCSNRVKFPTCLVCPVEGGAFKSTTDKNWIHLACALWIPELKVVDTDEMGPIEGFSSIDPERFKLLCKICKKRHGCAMQCVHKTCTVAFHPLCARKFGYRMEIIETDLPCLPCAFVAYCPKHYNDVFIAEDYASELKRLSKSKNRTPFTPKKRLLGATKLTSPSQKLSLTKKRVNSKSGQNQSNDNSNSKRNVSDLLIMSDSSDCIQEEDPLEVEVPSENLVDGELFWKKINEDYFRPIVANDFSRFDIELEEDCYNDSSFEIPPLGFFPENASKNPLEFFSNFESNAKIASRLGLELSCNEQSSKRITVQLSHRHKASVLCTFDLPLKKIRGRNSLCSPKSLSSSRMPSKANLNSFLTLSDKREDDELRQELLNEQQQLMELIQENNAALASLCSIISNEEETDVVSTTLKRNRELIREYQETSHQQYLRIAFSTGIRDHDESLTELADTSVCNICFNGESSVGNPIVFCEKCNVPVHKYCYGLPDIPDDDWFCQTCSARRDHAFEGKLQCRLCPQEWGVLKQVRGSGWAHVFCAVVIPDVNFGDIRKMEPIENVESSILRSKRESLQCNVCHLNHGACIRCSYILDDGSQCSAAFHPLCAWFSGLSMNVDITGTLWQVQTFCREHCVDSDSRDFTRQAQIRLQYRHHRRDNSSALARRQSSTEDESEGKVVLDDYYESGRCAVCFHTGELEDNPIWSCSVCGMSYHKKCFGLTNAQLRDRQCKRCRSTRSSSECALCPRRGGALKQTVDGRWVHMSCVLWIPEVNRNYRPLRLHMIKRTRMEKSCGICGRKHGACIPCSHQRCGNYFHVMCGLFSGACWMNVYDKRGDLLQEPISFCWMHTNLTLYRSPSFPEGYQRLLALRKDLDKARTILDLVRRREKFKRTLVKIEHQIFLSPAMAEKLTLAENLKLGIFPSPGKKSGKASRGRPPGRKSKAKRPGRKRMISETSQTSRTSASASPKSVRILSRKTQGILPSTPDDKVMTRSHRRALESSSTQKSRVESVRGRKRRRTMASGEDDSRKKQSSTGDSSRIIEENVELSREKNAAFEENESVLVRQGPLLYEGKIIKILDASQYLIHYVGWAKRWDEAVQEDRILKSTEKNKKTQKKLAKEFGAPLSNNRRRTLG